MKLANLMYVTPSITASTYRQPLGKCKRRGWMPSGKLQGHFKDWSHERPRYREKLSHLVRMSVCSQAEVVKKTGQSCFGHLMPCLRTGVIEDEMALLPCWAVQRFRLLCRGDTCAVLELVLQSLQWGLWLPAPFSLNRAGVPAGQAQQDLPHGRRSSSTL